jgi:hypothetical protein
MNIFLLVILTVFLFPVSQTVAALFFIIFFAPVFYLPYVLFKIASLDFKPTALLPVIFFPLGGSLIVFLMCILIDHLPEKILDYMLPGVMFGIFASIIKFLLEVYSPKARTEFKENLNLRYGKEQYYENE